MNSLDQNQKTTGVLSSAHRLSPHTRNVRYAQGDDRFYECLMPKEIRQSERRERCVLPQSKTVPGSENPSTVRSAQCTFRLPRQRRG